MADSVVWKMSGAMEGTCAHVKLLSRHEKWCFVIDKGGRVYAVHQAAIS